MEFVKMDIVYIMTLFNCYVYVTSEYQVIRSIHNRSEIADSCILATPNISANGITFTANLAKDLLEDGETAWVGYAMDYQMFQYIGFAWFLARTKRSVLLFYRPVSFRTGITALTVCRGVRNPFVNLCKLFKRENVRNDTFSLHGFYINHNSGCVRINDTKDSKYNVTYTESNVSPGPGYCSGACIESSMFGITLNQNSCYCFNTGLGDVFINRWDCDNVCDNSDFACGGDNELSIYKQVQVRIPIKESKDYDKNCLLYDVYNKKHTWEECEETEKVTCMLENGKLTMLAEKEKWRRAADACFQEERSKQLAYVYNKSVVPKDRSWTALMRTLAIHKQPAQPIQSISKEHHFCYVEKNGGIYTVHFTQNTSFTSRAICLKVTSDPETSTQSKITDLNDAEKSTQNTGAYVGIACGVLLVIILSVVMCVFWKRRQNTMGTNGTVDTKRPVKNHVIFDNKHSDQFETNTNHNHDQNHKVGSDRNDLRDIPSKNRMAGALVYDNACHLPETERGSVTVDSGNGGKTSYSNVSNKDKTALDSQLYSSTYSTVNKMGTVAVTKSNEKFEAIPSDDYAYTYDISEEHYAHTYDRTGHGTIQGNNGDTYDHIGQKGLSQQDSRLYDKIPAQDTDQMYDSTSSVPVKQYNGDNLYSHTHADNMDYSSCNVNSKVGTGTNPYQY